MFCLPMKRPDRADSCAIGGGACGAKYTRHHLLPSSPVNVWCVILLFLRVVPVPWGLRETSSASYLRARGTLSQELLPAERLVSNPMHQLKYLF